MDDAWLSELDVNHEAVGLIVDRLAAELDEFASARRLGHLAVEVKRGLVLDVLASEASNLILCGPVVASGASGLAIRLAFNPEAYRRAAEAANDRAVGYPV